ncbi:MAG: hypothetical protein RJA22_2282 [Verrucomicrobiota bacterium]
MTPGFPWARRGPALRRALALAAPACLLLSGQPAPAAEPAPGAVPAAAPAVAVSAVPAPAAGALSREERERRNTGSEVVVVYNLRMPESRQVADYYAQRRAVPTNQLLGLDLPLTEAISRPDYLERLQGPVFRWLEEQGLLTFSPATNVVPGRPELPPFRQALAARVRYVLLCYGVPVKILRDPTLKEAGTENLALELKRTEAAVDSQLTLLPVSEAPAPWAGPLRNPFALATNTGYLHPVNGLLMVTRLDGPTPELARALVDRALEGETNGLWGRAYFDLRGLTNGGYKAGDDMLGMTALAASRHGFEVTLDEKPETFPARFPLSQAALYMGWYDQHVSPLFGQPHVEFMPGAFAYHLYSFSAQTLRTTNDMWAGLLLARGAACTMGSVDEPYLSGTPDLFAFLTRWLSGWTYGEAAIAAQGSISWQTTIIGDPLYRPFARDAAALRAELEQRQSPFLEWAWLQAINRLRTNGTAAPALQLEFLNSTRLPLLNRSAVLTEKVGDLHWAAGNLSDAIEAYENALKRGPSRAQRMRLLLTLAEKRSATGPDDKALGWYEQLLREFPQYPDALGLHQQMLALAKRLKRLDLIERCEREIRLLGPPPAANGTTPKA